MTIGEVFAWITSNTPSWAEMGAWIMNLNVWWLLLPVVLVIIGVMTNKELKGDQNNGNGKGNSY